MARPGWPVIATTTAAIPSPSTTRRLLSGLDDRFCRARRPFSCTPKCCGCCLSAAITVATPSAPPICASSASSMASDASTAQPFACTSALRRCPAIAPSTAATPPASPIFVLFSRALASFTSSCNPLSHMPASHGSCCRVRSAAETPPSAVRAGPAESAVLEPSPQLPVLLDGEKPVKAPLNTDEPLALDPDDGVDELPKDMTENGEDAELEAVALELRLHALELPGSENPVNVVLNGDELLVPELEEDKAAPKTEDPELGKDTNGDPAVLNEKPALPTPLLVADGPTEGELLKLEPAAVDAAAATGAAPPKVKPPDPNVKPAPSAAFGAAPGRAVSHP
mmetsp:Transcript_126254/g.218734  ORF Transcript_126254/g.218734 Transcript_126254/m.218734 type:complete len:339 (+) Transcript_126254:1-1017(+)